MEASWLGWREELTHREGQLEPARLSPGAGVDSVRELELLGSWVLSLVPTTKGHHSPSPCPPAGTPKLESPGPTNRAGMGTTSTSNTREGERSPEMKVPTQGHMGT